MDTIVVTGGAGFIGANFVRTALAADRRARRGARQAHLRRQPREPGRRLDATRATRSCRPTSPTARRCARLLRRAPARGRRQLRRRDPRRPLDRRPGRVRAHERHRRLRAARGARGCICASTPRGRLPLPPRLDRRGLRHARRDGRLLRETTPYAPNSPYAASKAGADHLVRAYHETYGLPVLLTNCSNNYGPYQFPEKLIPLMILNAVEGKPLPIYGDGGNVRDWLYVEDHCDGHPAACCATGAPGEKYNIGGGNERTNLAGRGRDLRGARRRAAGGANPALVARGLASYASSRPSCRTAPATTAATRSTPRRSAPSSAGRPRHAFEAGPARAPCAGTSRTAPGARRCRPGKYRRERLGLATAEPMKFIPTELAGRDADRARRLQGRARLLPRDLPRAKYARGRHPGPFVQDNHSYSARGTLRGLHAQLRSPQGKLVRAVEGEMFDVAVDIRRGSPTFGRWVGRHALGRELPPALGPARLRPRLLRR